MLPLSPCNKVLLCTEKLSPSSLSPQVFGAYLALVALLVLPAATLFAHALRNFMRARLDLSRQVILYSRPIFNALHLDDHLPIF